MSSLQALTYTSRARQWLTRPQIDHLLARARERNAQEQVTGVLLYTNGLFMQYLEGPQLNLSTIWTIIKDDPLHHQIAVRSHEPIRVRDFAEWSMAFRAGGTYGLSHPMHLDALLSSRYLDISRSTSTSIEGLVEFWNQHRGSSAV